jgi:hypothetical protein
LYSVGEDYTVVPNFGGVLASFQPTGSIELAPIDDTMVNGERSLLLTLTPDPMFNIIPFIITVNESVVIIEDDDALSKLMTVCMHAAIVVACVHERWGGGGGGG